jgi:hypothetical protein
MVEMNRAKLVAVVVLAATLGVFAARPAEALIPICPASWSAAPWEEPTMIDWSWALLNWCRENAGGWDWNQDPDWLGSRRDRVKECSRPYDPNKTCVSQTRDIVDCVRCCWKIYNCNVANGANPNGPALDERKACETHCETDFS